MPRLFLLLALLSACSTPTGNEPSLAAPDEADAAYAEAAAELSAKYQEPTPAPLPGPAGEPQDMLLLLREWEPHLLDPADDQVGEGGHDDLLSAVAVTDGAFLYARIITRKPMADGERRELRFWAEQEHQQLTIEVKVNSPGSPCETSPAGSTDEQQSVPACFWLGSAIDLRIPVEALRPAIDASKPFWVSGFQTCCIDPARDKPFDRIDDSQEVWRVQAQPTPAGGTP